MYIRVVHGDINFGILRDPLNFLFPMDPKRPYWTKFLIRNGSFLLTKAHAFGANWTERPPTSKAFLGHLSLWKGVWNVSRINELALRFPKMVWKSQIGPKMTELQNFESYQLLQIRTAVAAAGCEASLQSLIQPNTTRPLLWFLKIGNFQSSVARSFLIRFDFFTPFLETSERAR